MTANKYNKKRKEIKEKSTYLIPNSPFDTSLSHFYQPFNLTTQIPKMSLNEIPVSSSIMKLAVFSAGFARHFFMDVSFLIKG